MLYDTHKRYGQVAGILAVPVVVESGLVNYKDVLVDNFVGFDATIVSYVVMALMLVIAYKASLFGAEFPDLDSPTSTPSKKHRILPMVFKMFGVKHRGKFSHDFVVQTIFWAMMYIGLVYVGSNFVESSLTMFGVELVKVFVVFTWVGVMSHLIADAMTKDGVWFAGLFKIRFMPVFICKIGLGNWKPFKHAFTTASAWNDMNYKFMTVMIPLAVLFVGWEMFI